MPPLFDGYREVESRKGDKKVSTLLGNMGCADRCKKFTEISKSAKAWGLNEDARRHGIPKRDEEYNQLSRRFGRYKGVRLGILQSTRREMATSQQLATFIICGGGHERLLGRRSVEWYRSEGDGGTPREKRGKWKQRARRR